MRILGPRPLWLLVSFVVAGLMTGCAGSTKQVVEEFDASSNQTTYRARGISIAIESPGSGYGSQLQRVMMHLNARCRGRQCTPRMAQLTLSTGGSGDLYIGDRTLTIQADQETFTWRDEDYERQKEPQRVVGVILRVQCSIDRLRKMATARTLIGRVGGVSMNLTKQDQQQILSFVQQIHNKEQPPA